MKNEIEENLRKWKELKAKGRNTMTPERLKSIEGFEYLSDESAQEVIDQMNEYAAIVLKQLSRLGKLP